VKSLANKTSFFSFSSLGRQCTHNVFTVHEQSDSEISPGRHACKASSRITHKPLRMFHPTSPSLDERGHLCAFNDPMIRAPAHTNLKPPLRSFTIFISNDPFCTPNGDNGYASTGDEERCSPFALADSSNITNSQGPSFLWHLFDTQTPSFPSTEDLQAPDLAHDLIRTEGVYTFEGWRVEARGSGEGERDVGVWTKGQGWFIG